MATHESCTRFAHHIAPTLIAGLGLAYILFSTDARRAASAAVLDPSDADALTDARFDSVAPDGSDHSNDLMARKKRE
jgi:hypothetical protein